MSLRTLLSLLLLTAPLAVHAEEAWETCCRKCAAFANQAALGNTLSGGNQRQYAPDRIFDVKHLKIDLTPDFESHSLTGRVWFTFTPIAEPQLELSLDAVDLDVQSVTGTKPLSHSVQANQITCLFDEPIQPGQTATVEIAYTAHPTEGLYFRTPDMGYPETDTQCWTQGEPERHRHWFPSYDYPNERFTTEVVCRVPEGMTALSNGILLSNENDPADPNGLVAWHWRQNQPHVNYLVSVVAGHFRHLHAAHGDLDLAFYTPPSAFHVAENSFRDTVNILAWFERELDVPYPWDKYYNVCVHDFVAGGMENTSLTTLTLNTLFDKSTGTLHTTRRLDAHEIAHQWFGDLVTCKDWSHLWLNEGFATYYTELYDAHAIGPEILQYEMWRKARSILENKDEKPIVWRGYGSPWDQFDYRAYPKGAWVLHMLRTQLGADLFRRCVTDYLTSYRDDIAVTADLHAVFEDLSGRSLDRFFDQWVYHGGEPDLKVTHRYDATRKEAKLTVEQVQKTSDKVLLFDVPLPVRFHTADGVIDQVLRVTRKKEDFTIPLDGAPTQVLIDPDVTVLTRVNFRPTNPQLLAQLTNLDTPMARVGAITLLATKHTPPLLDALATRLCEDDFYAVRLEAAKALDKIRTPAAFKHLLAAAAADQPDDRVRLQLVRAIGNVYDPRARAHLLHVARTDTNPEIVGAALKALGKFEGPAVRDALTKALDRPSFRDVLARGAVDGIAAFADPAHVPVLLDHLRAPDPDLPTRTFGKHLETLARLASRAPKPQRTEVRRFLLTHANAPREPIQLAALRALGHLGDVKATAALSGFQNHGAADKTRAKRVHDEANKALNALRETKPHPQEVKALRKTVDQLLKKVEALEKAQKE